MSPLPWTFQVEEKPKERKTKKMSEENTETAPTEEKTRRNSIPRTEVDEMIAGIPQFEKKAFTMVGNEKARGVRLAIASTKNVSRVYFYADDDYQIIPELPGIVVFSKEDRKENHRGGVMAEIDFAVGADAARVALQALVDVVRSAPPKAPRPERKVKAPKAETTETDGGDDVVVPTFTAPTEPADPDLATFSDA